MDLFAKSRLAQSHAFYTDPDAFITTRLRQFDGNRVDTRSESPIVRAEILDRNVHIATSYRLCCALLGSPIADGSDVGRSLRTALATAPSYQPLMAAFFPPPNMLLTDGDEHVRLKAAWQTAFAAIPEASVPLIRELTVKTMQGLAETQTQIDLYETMKTLAWDLLLAIFLGLHRDGAKAAFDQMETLQENVLRGQFSLFPVSLRTPFWTSARSRGLKAVRDLGPAIQDHLNSRWKETSSSCPFAAQVVPTAMASGPLSEGDIVSHVRLFTSSIANKALASLLTAFFMNLFLWSDDGVLENEASIAQLVSAQSDLSVREAMLHSVLQETSRLSPPIIGVMRRVTQTIPVKHPGGYAIPAGHDAWLYFAAANRDPAIFDRPDDFRWDRFMDGTSTNRSVAFGLGPKRCLGSHFVEQICLTAAEAAIDSRLCLCGAVERPGVRRWLGWKALGERAEEDGAGDLKQLPCQRPRQPVLVNIRVNPSAT